MELDAKFTSDSTWAWVAGTSHEQLINMQKSVKRMLSEWHKEFLMCSNLTL